MFGISRISWTRIIAAAGILLIFFAAPGCNEYDAEVTVRPDGSGTRSVRLTLNIDTDNGKRPDFDMIRTLLSLEDSSVWRRDAVEGDGQAEGKIISDRAEFDGKRAAFICDHQAGGPEEWAGMSGDISVTGALDSEKGSGVRLSNRISLDRASSGGLTLFTYRETLEWKGLRPFILDYVSHRFVDEVLVICPWIEISDKAELRGLASGHFGMAFDQIDDEDVYEALLESMSVSLFEATLQVTERSGSDTDRKALHEIIDNLVWDRDNSFDSFLESSLPGASLAFSTELRLELSLPGKIVDTNGEVSDDGSSVSWKVGLLDPFTGPLELYARSELQD